MDWSGRPSGFLATSKSFEPSPGDNFPADPISENLVREMHAAFHQWNLRALLTAAVLALSAAPAGTLAQPVESGQTFAGRVVSVTDGDT